MSFGVVVQSRSAAASMIEISPMDTSRPLIRLLRVKRNSSWSAANPHPAAMAIAGKMATG
jgi:hypothetical protein